MDWLDFVAIGAAVLMFIIGIYELSTKKCIAKIINKKYTKDSIKKYLPTEAFCYILLTVGLIGVGIGDIPELAAGDWATGGYAMIIAALLLNITCIHKILKSK